MKTLTTRLAVLCSLILAGWLLVGCSENQDEVGRQSDETKAGANGGTQRAAWQRFHDPYFAFGFDYPSGWEVVLADAHRFAAQESDDFVVVAEGSVVAPVPDADRSRATTNVLNSTLDEMGIKGAASSQVRAGVAHAFSAAGKTSDGRWAWMRVTTHGDIMYRIRVVCAEGLKSRCEPLAGKILESFEVTDEVRIAGSPYGHDVVSRSITDAPIPDGWRLQENKFGFRFAHPGEWKLSERSRKNGYDYETEGITLSCVAAANYIQEPNGMQLRRSLRQAFDSELPRNGKLTDGPTTSEAGMVDALVGSGTLPNDAGRFWLAVAVHGDIWYLLHVRCRSGCDEFSSTASRMVASLQVTEALDQSEFMKRLMDRPLPWENR